MRIYMDNCCYNRPYDDQSSFALTYENGKNRFAHKREAISEFMEANALYYVGMEHDKQVAEIAESIRLTGAKDMDAFHVACAIFSESDFFITTDDRVLKFQSEKVEIVTPVEFIRRMEENGDE